MRRLNKDTGRNENTGSIYTGQDRKTRGLKNVCIESDTGNCDSSRISVNSKSCKSLYFSEF